MNTKTTEPGHLACVTHTSPAGFGSNFPEAGQRQTVTHTEGAGFGEPEFTGLGHTTRETHAFAASSGINHDRRVT